MAEVAGCGCCPRLPTGRTAAECFNRHMDRHGASPVVAAPKPRRYLASVAEAAGKSAAGTSKEAKAGAPFPRGIACGCV